MAIDIPINCVMVAPLTEKISRPSEIKAVIVTVRPLHYMEIIKFAAPLFNQASVP